MGIEEGNKLIAEFMGTHICPNRYDKPGLEYWIKGSWWTVRTLRYNSSWDWLMPAVVKIEDKGYEVSILDDECDISNMGYLVGTFVSEKGPTKLEAVWNAVVGFIELYNNDKLPE